MSADNLLSQYTHKPRFLWKRVCWKGYIAENRHQVMHTLDCRLRGTAGMWIWMYEQAQLIIGYLYSHEYRLCFFSSMTKNGSSRLSAG